MGLLDILYFFILLGTLNNTSSFTFVTLLQATLLIRVFLLKFLTDQRFRLFHYLGVLIILIGNILSFVNNADKFNFLLLVGMLLHSINNIIKRHYLKKFKVGVIQMNQFVFLFATIFGLIFILGFGLLASKNLSNSLKSELYCLVGIDCYLNPLFLFFLLISTFFHQVLLKKTNSDIQGQRVVYLISALVTFLAFFCVEVVINEVEGELFQFIFVIIAIAGSVVYHSFPEIPQKFSYCES